MTDARKLMTVGDLEQLRHKERRANDAFTELQDHKAQMRKTAVKIEDLRKQMERMDKMLPKLEEESTICNNVFITARKAFTHHGFPSVITSFSPLRMPQYLKAKIEAEIAKRKDAKARQASE